MIFEMFVPNRIIFGCGSINKIGDAAHNMGQNALIVCGGGSVHMECVIRLIRESGIDVDIFRVVKEPDISIIRKGLDAAKENKSDFVIGFGGGSVMDAAKAIAALMTNTGDILDYLEVVGKGREIENYPTSMIAVPTTAGTGTEVTKNAVIRSPQHHVKVSMRSTKMIPTVAIVDPELTYSMPPSITASTGMDAFTQVIEAYVSNRANPITDVISLEGVTRGARSLLKAYKDGENKHAREDMALTSLFGGIALANAGLGAVHGFAGPIGGMFKSPHGAVCASLLSSVMKYNVKVLSTLDDQGETRNRYQEIAAIVTGDQNASIQDGVGWLAELTDDLCIPGLHEIGVKKSDFDWIITKSKISSSMQKNPVVLDEKTMHAILMEAY